MEGIEKLSISILDLDIKNIDQSMKGLWDIGIRNIHIDIIDTSFIDNISFGVSFVNCILQYSGFDFFIHIMIKNPILIISKLKYPKGTKIAVHSHFEDVLKLEHIVPVLSINPEQNIDQFKHYVPRFKEVLIMTVYPGFGGQKLIEGCVNKIKCFQLCGVKVTVDGGINIFNISQVKHADSIVVGSAFTMASDKMQTLKELLEKIG
ncbi:ribulose-phosphate 3-epimerase [Vittaforma corneae ATCC 50505]|uniref:Ribulose-phosphate 3-epimerase n=1 Tax=Vittaforma corneae (strain ATCC 50505) TaxID=993615 RepID=L2GN91_VITCO|nr:ribulose-phosphate 3-epimerase [Vittaforma corneae ATCC 50505]ELA42301.1 ribulose-phosphate 3-epimerase [Vittaforma corneae ATCC 50505]